MCYGKITAGGFYMSDKNDELEKILNEIKNGKSQEHETNFSINESKKEAPAVWSRDSCACNYIGCIGTLQYDIG